MPDQSNSSATLRLVSDGLLSRWGFGDGDMPGSVYDYCEAHGIDYEPINWHATLVKLVRAYLLPVLEQDVEVYEVETIHNPIRAETVDGNRVNPYEIPSATLTPEYVDVLMAVVIEFAKEERP